MCLSDVYEIKVLGRGKLEHSQSEQESNLQTTAATPLLIPQMGLREY